MGGAMANKTPKPILLLFWLLVSGYWLLSLSGCATTATKSSDPTQVAMLEPATLQKFADVPTPAGFVFVPEESYIFQSAGFRAGLLKYKGKASGDQAVVFFKEQMPLYNWHLVNIVEHGRRMLSFEKEQEACVITIDENGNRAQIAVSVAPKSQIIYRKTDKPIK